MTLARTIPFFAKEKASSTCCIFRIYSLKSTLAALCSLFFINASQYAHERFENWGIT
jgi:hypothetical protein